MTAGRDNPFRGQIEQMLARQAGDAETWFARGNALYMQGQYEAAAESYERAIQLYPRHAEALNNRGSALHALGRYEAALECYDQAIRLKPEYADAHANRGNVLLGVKQYAAALESSEQAIRLRPESAEAWNNRGSALHALQQHRAAVASFDRALQLRPDFVLARIGRSRALEAIEQYRTAVAGYEKAMRLDPDFGDVPESPEVEQEVARLGRIRDAAKLKAELDALPVALQSHPAVCGLRNVHFERTGTTGRDLVFYCLPTGEMWNPETARTRGIGGSEEAVVWLSRLLRERGWNVTVYGECGARAKDYDGVCWKPHWMWSYRDRQDVTVLWRYPLERMEEINSARVVVDLHDVVSEAEFTAERLRKIDRIFVKSRFQRALFPRVPEEKFVVVPNGIDAEMFSSRGDRDPMLTINTSSPERSLEAFLDCFAEIRQQVPGAKAQWAFGWTVWDRFHAANPERLAWKQRMQARMNALGVEELGRLNHSEVAQLYRRANIFAYPSEMAEIDCISLSKAMAAGAIPITTSFGAMGEKSGHGGVFIGSKKTIGNWSLRGQFHFEMTDPEQKAEFVREAVKLLLHPPSEDAREPMREWARSTFDWNRVAGAWSEALAQPVKHPAEELIGGDLAEAQAHFDRGNTLFLGGELKAAAESYDRALLLNPDHAEAWNNRGSALNGVGQYAAAVESYERAIGLQPQYAEGHSNRGNALHSLKRYEEALASSDRAIALKPQHAEAWGVRGNALVALERHAEALESLDEAIALRPEFVDAHCNRGNALQGLKQYDAALESYDRAIALKPDFAEAWNNRGSVLQALERFAEAIESYDRALARKPELAEAHCNRGNALYALERYAAAAANYDRALELKPDFAEAYRARGDALQAMREFGPALESYEQAIALNPQLVEAFHNRGSALHAAEQYEAALESYNQAARLKPDYEYLLGTRLHLRMSFCDWEGMEEERKKVEAGVERGEKVVAPFAMLPIGGSPAIERKAAEIFARDKFPARPAKIERGSGRQRIRIGYFSADFHNHATSYLMAELFELHDRSRFEVLGFSFGPEASGGMRARVSGAMDRFIDVRSMTDSEVARLSRELGVDIAVDLKGFTRDARPGIFARRAAAIQASYLGYPGTIGAEWMDYLIADATLIPPNDRQHYAEKIVTLPGSYQVNDSRRAIAEGELTRADEGLPEGAFVFCCFNRAYKITPAVFDVWMRVLGRVEGSVLWLFDENSLARGNLRKEAERRGIDADRLVFAGGLPLEKHLARQRMADLFLDTLPYNAHTTASDALWAGLPVLTRKGETFAGRVAASLLCAVGLPELVTSTSVEFEELAVALATDRARLQELRARLQANRMTAPLFDCRGFTRYMEAAYGAMIERYDAGLPAEAIDISDSETVLPDGRSTRAAVTS